MVALEAELARRSEEAASLSSQILDQERERAEKERAEVEAEEAGAAAEAEAKRSLDDENRRERSNVEQLRKLKEEVSSFLMSHMNESKQS